MNNSIRLIYCIIGSLVLSFISLPNFYDSIIFIPIIGHYLANLTYYVSSVGILLTIFICSFINKRKLQINITYLRWEMFISHFFSRKIFTKVLLFNLHIDVWVGEGAKKSRKEV